MSSIADDEEDYYNYDDGEEFLDYDKSNSEAFKYEEILVDEVQAILNQDVESLSEFLKVPISTARLLLAHSEWKMEQVKSMFLSDPIAFMVKLFILPPRTSSPTVSDSPAVMSAIRTAERCQFPVRAYLALPKLEPDPMCSICCTAPSPSSSIVEFFTEPSPINEPTFFNPESKRLRTNSNVRSEQNASNNGLYGLSCGHRFCPECWCSYLTVQIGEGLSLDIKCMAASCSIVIPEDFILSLLKFSPMKEKYLRLIFKRTVNSHPALRLCPGVDCPVVIHALEPPKARRVCCSRCKSEFCFVCKEAYHAPTTCELMRRWLVKCRDDSGTATYMAAYTKDCPACHVCIEKNGGCNHMQCTKCCHEFCWVCLEDWSVHQNVYFSCSRYSEEGTDEGARSLARESLKRYVFYYERWLNHERSLQLEQEHRTRVQKRIDEKLKNREGTWIDWQYLLTAADTLRNCRYTLKFTYPYAFFGEKLERKELFEYQQALLESEVEDLAWKIERAEITDRASLQSAMDICEKHRLNLLQEFLKD